MTIWQFLTENSVHIKASIMSLLWLWTVIGLSVSGQLKETKSGADIFWQMVILGPAISTISIIIVCVWELADNIRSRKK